MEFYMRLEDAKGIYQAVSAKSSEAEAHQQLVRSLSAQIERVEKLQSSGARLNRINHAMIELGDLIGQAVMTFGVKADVIAGPEPVHSNFTSADIQNVIQKASDAKEARSLLDRIMNSG
jgi:hypothetical protein